MAIAGRRQRDKKKTKARHQPRTRSPQSSGHAKLTAPEIERVHLRTHLFRQIDQARRHAAVVWVSAPAGAGKTTLAASYLSQRKFNHLWYRLDAGDADPASYFYFLGQAARALAPRRPAPPLLTPEYMLGLPVFAANFFRELCTRLKPPALLVLDNYQDLPLESPLHDLLVSGFAELPKGVVVLVLSRTDPPPAYARLRAAHELALFGASTLQLTVAESAAIARLHQPRAVHREMTERLHALTQGWAAGLVLLLQPKTSDIRSVEPPARDGMPSVLFDYFASEVMRHTEPDVQGFLRHSALLPQMTAESAAALTHNSRAGEILNDLVRRNYFVVQHGRPSPTYEYHPLFREFLLNQVNRVVPPADLRALRQHAAQLLIRDGQYEEAIALLHSVGDVDALAALVVAQAPTLIAQGRHRTIEQWLLRVPQDRRDHDPWLQYWIGAACLPFSPLEARGYFERAYHRFKQSTDAAGAYLAWAGGIETFILMWDDFTDIQRWFDEYSALRKACPLFPSPQVEARVHAAMFEALIYTQPQIPEMQHARQRVEALLHENLDADFNVRLVNSLALYYAWVGSFGDQRRVVELGRSICESNPVAPLSRMMAAFFQSTYLWLTGEVGNAVEIVQEALQIADDSGVHIMDALAVAQLVYAHGILGDVAAMGRELRKVQHLVSPHRRLDLAHYHYQMGWYTSLKQAYEQAITHQRQALDLATQMSAQVPVALCRIGLAQMLALTGSFEEALGHLDAAQAFARAMSSLHIEFMAGVIRAYARLRQGQDVACADALRPALRLAAENGYWMYPTWDPAIMSPLCAFALRHEIEPRFVRALIRRWNLQPDVSSADLDAWPFPLKIHTLGRFNLLRDDQPVRFEGKAQKKPLELLKLLVSLGGREVAETRIFDALWPDTEADQARQNFKATLHRLRKLIGNDVLLLNEGKLSLDPLQVWVDVWACERLLNESREQLHVGYTQKAIESGRGAVKLYQGAFLAADDQPFFLPLRERLRAKLLAHIGDLARSHCEAKACNESLALYRKGLEIDPLTESFYRGLMRCYQCLLQPAEALKTYERCREMLQSQLGVDPGPQTIALEQDIRHSFS